MARNKARVWVWTRATSSDKVRARGLVIKQDKYEYCSVMQQVWTIPQ